jgi:hypothetical protein
MKIEKRIRMGSLLLLLACASMGHIAEAREKAGNGGGGVIRNGVYLTFGSAKVRIRRETLASVPALGRVQDMITALLPDAKTRGRFLRALFPAGNRMYYRIEKADLDPKKREELLKSYHDAIRKQVPLNTLVVFAVTKDDGSTGLQETFLLPEFFELNEVQQAAILFHEAIWIVNPYMTYAEVIDAEITTQDYLERVGTDYRYDAEMSTMLARILGDPGLALQMAARDDYVQGRLKAYLLDDGRLPLRFIFGQEAISCRTPSGLKSESDLVDHLVTSMQRNPEIELLRQVYALRKELRLELWSKWAARVEACQFPRPWEIEKRELTVALWERSYYEFHSKPKPVPVFPLYRDSLGKMPESTVLYVPITENYQY